MPNIVEGFFGSLGGRYYMFALTEAFHDGLREIEKMVICCLGFPKAWLIFTKQTVVFKIFLKTFCDELF